MSKINPNGTQIQNGHIVGEQEDFTSMANRDIQTLMSQLVGTFNGVHGQRQTEQTRELAQTGLSEETSRTDDGLSL